MTKTMKAWAKREKKKNVHFMEPQATPLRYATINKTFGIKHIIINLV